MSWSTFHFRRATVARVQSHDCNPTIAPFRVGWQRVHDTWRSSDVISVQQESSPRAEPCRATISSLQQVKPSIPGKIDHLASNQHRNGTCRQGAELDARLAACWARALASLLAPYKSQSPEFVNGGSKSRTRTRHVRRSLSLSAQACDSTGCACADLILSAQPCAPEGAQATVCCAPIPKPRARA